MRFVVATRGALRIIFAALGETVRNALTYALQHPPEPLAIVASLLGWVIGMVVVAEALLVSPMKELFVLLYVALVAAAVVVTAKDRGLSKRLWVGLLTSSLALVGCRLVLDVVGLDQGSLRSNVTGLLGLLYGLTAYQRVRA